jgi:hypothetical protein
VPAAIRATPMRAEARAMPPSRWSAGV